MKATKPLTTLIIGLIVLSCFVSLYHVAPASAVTNNYSAIFTETGLASGTSWNVTLNGSTRSSTTNTVTFSSLSNGNYAYSVAVPSGYLITSPSSGSVSISGGDANRAVTFVVDQNWYKFHHDNQNTGASITTGPLTNHTKWTFSTGDYIMSSPIVVNDIAYIGSHDNKTYAINATTGTQIWSYTTNNWIMSTPCYYTGVIYVSSRDHNVYALNALTGAKIWNYTTDGEIQSSSPCVTGGIVYIGSRNGTLYALNATTGTQLWHYYADTSINSSPCVAGGAVYFGTSAGSVYSLNAATGARIWNYTTGSSVTSSPCVVGGIVYVGSNNDNVYALNAATGAQIWTYTTDSGISSSPCVVGGVVYVGSTDHHVYALNAATGTQIWNYTATNQISQSSPCFANGVLYIAPYDGKLLALNATTGTQLWRYIIGAVTFSSPCVANGVLYIGSNDRKLIAFEDLPTCTLTLKTVGSGNVSPGNQTFTQGDSVNITATPSAGWSFSGWSGDASGSSNTTITMSSNKIVTATFTQNNYTLTMHTVGTGSVLPGNQSYISGSSVDIKAINSAGWTFSGWSGDATGTANTTLTMNGDKVVTATFVPRYVYITALDSGLHGPTAVAVDSLGNIYVANVDLSCVQKYSSNGTFITQWYGNESAAGALNNPYGIAVDSLGSIYVADTYNNQIKKFTSTGTFITSWDSHESTAGALSNPIGIAVDSSGNVYVADQQNNRIQVFSSNGTFIRTWGSFGSGNGEFNSPWGVAVDSLNNVFVLDTGNNRVEKFSSEGTFIAAWGSSGSQNGQFTTPYSIAVDSLGNVYVSDSGNNRIQKFSGDGTFITAWGSEGSDPGKFSTPIGIIVDSSGNVFVADYNNNRVQKFALEQPPTTYTLTVNVAGLGTVTPSSGSYVVGSIVNLKAYSTSAGWTFSGWSGDASGTSNTTITMNSNKTVTATFTQNSVYTVTFTETGLASGASWNVTLNGVTHSSTTGTITFTGFSSGNFAYSITTPTGYTLQSPSSTGTITVVNSNITQPVSFASISTSDWPMLQHDPQHSSYTNTSGPISDHILWSLTGTGPKYYTAAVVNGVVYATTDYAGAFALNATTGAPIWNVLLAMHFYSAPAVVAGVVYTGPSSDSCVYALNATDGSTIWMSPVMAVYSGTTVVDGVVYLTGPSGVCALNATNGIEKWKHSTDSISSAPAVVNGKVYYGSESGFIIALDAETGDAAWSFPTFGQIYSSPSVVDGVLYIGATDTKLYAFNATTGAYLWAYWAPTEIRSSPAVANGIVYIGCDDGSLYAINAQTGAYMWSFSTGGPIRSVISIANDVVYFGSNDDYVYAVNVTDATEVWKYQTLADVQTGVSISNGNGYVSSDDGTFYAFGGDYARYSLTMNIIGQGSVTPGNSTMIDEGGQYILRATPAQGWSFAGWSGDVTGTSSTIGISHECNKTVTATFVENTYTLTMLTVGSGTVNPGNVTTYRYGDVVNITATNAAGWGFSGWSGGASGSSNTTITMNSNKTVTATFTQNPAYSVTFTETGLASGTSWSVTLDGSTKTSLTNTIIFTGLANGNYAYSLTAPSGYSVNSSSGTIAVADGNVNHALSFAPNPNWQMYRNSISYTGYTLSDGPVTNNTIWAKSVCNARSSPAVYNGVVYVGASGKLYAVNASTGDTIWSYSSNAIFSSGPSIDSGVVFVGCFNANVYALNATTGSKIWNYTTAASINTSPVVTGGVVYVVASDGYTYALNQTTGEKLWMTLTGSISYSSPAVANGLVYVFSGSDTRVNVVNATTGNLSWSFITSNSPVSSPTIDGDVLYIGTNSALYAVNTTTHAQIWNYTGATFKSTPAVANGVVYVGASNGNLYAFNALTGGLLWTYTASDFSWSSPVVSGQGIVYIGSTNNIMYALSASNGSCIWQYQTNGYFVSSPAISNGTLYASCGDGNLYAFSAPQNYYLTMKTVGQGSVLPSNGTQTAGATVSLQAIAAAGWTFSGWSGDATGTTNTTITMDSNKTVTATFTQNTYNVTFTETGLASGTSWNVTLNGNTQTSTTASITFTDLPDAQYPYSVSSPAGYIANDTSGTVTVAGANVAKCIKYNSTAPPDVIQLTVTSGGVGGLTTPSSGVHNYTLGESASVSASASFGYEFSYWLLDGNENSTSLTINLTMNANHTIQPVFTQITRSLTMITVGGGSVEPGNHSYALWSGVDIKAIPDAGWSFSGWSGDASGSDNTTIAMNSNKTVTALFTQLVPYNVTFTQLGLADGTSWNVTLDGENRASTNSTITFSKTRGTYTYTICAPSGYVCASAATGTLAVSDADLNQTIVYSYLQGSDWPMFLHDIAHTSYSATAGPLTNQTQWSSSTGNGAYSSPAVVDGVIYIGSYDRNVYAYNATTGQQIWRYLTGGRILYSSTAVVDGVVYVGSRDTKVYALNATTGQQIWNYATNGEVLSSPTVVGGVVYVGSTNNKMYALDAATGQPIWNYTVGSGVQSTPAVSNGIVYFGAYNGRVYALNASNGNHVWNSTTTTNVMIISSPAVVDGVVYIGSTDNKVYVFNATTGQQIWSYTTNGSVESSPTIVNGVVYIGSNDKNMYALDAATGQKIWNYTTGGYVFASPIVANEVVYVASRDNFLYALNASTGSTIWKYLAESTLIASPAIVDDVLYLVSNNGVLYAFGYVPEYTLTMITSGQGTVSPGNQTYTSGAIANLTATPAAGWSFSGWSGDVTGTANTTIIMNANKTITATFTQDSYLLTIITIGQGTVTNANQTFLSGTNVDLSASEDAGWSFGGWSGDLAGSTNPASIVMNVNKSVTVTFTQNTYIIGFDIVGNGSVSRNVSQPYVYGQVVNFTAVPDAGWSFSDWQGAKFYETNTVFTYQVYSNRTFTVTFTQDTYTLTMLTVGTGSVLPGNQSYLSGSSVDIKAVAGAGWSFSGWTGDASGASNTTLTMTGNLTVTATFTQNTYTLTMVTLGRGTVQPGNGSYTYGDQVDLKAITVAGWSFDNWSGDASGSSNRTITMDANMTVTATFVQDTYTLTMITVGNGSVLPGNQSYLSGTNVDIKAINSAGWTFSGWAGNVAGSTNTTITMTGNMTVTATFTQDTYTLTMVTLGGGSVLPGNQSYLSGTNVDLKAVNNAGWSFSGWSGDASGSTNTTITLDANKTVTATFTQDTYTLTMVTVGTGSVSPGNQSYLSGSAVDIKAIVDAGWHFNGWSGAASGSENTTVTMTGNLTVTATFTQDTYTLTMVTIGSGSVLPGNQSYLSGASVDLKAINNAGWTFSGWAGDASGSTNTTVTMNGNMTVTATFTQDTYTLTMITVGSGFVSPGNQSYLSNTGVDITATAVTGWHFSGWSGDASGSTNTTITMTGNLTITATFTQDTYTLTMITVGGCSVLPGNQSYLSGTDVDIKAITTAGWKFISWSGDASGSTNTTITMTGNLTVTALFIDRFRLTFTQAGLPSGTSWNVTLNGHTLVSSTDSITFTGKIAGNYTYSVACPTGYASNPAFGTARVTNDDVAISVAYGVRAMGVWGYGGNQSDYANDMIATPDGGYLLLGTTFSYGQGGDVYLVKVDANGTQLWSRTYGGLDFEEGYGIAASPDGGYMIVGCTYSFGSGLGDIYLLKLDSNFNEQWCKTFGGAYFDCSTQIIATADGGYALAGYTLSFSRSMDAWLLKVDSNGNQQWSTIVGDNFASEYGYNVAETNDGNYVLVGSAADDFYIVKVSDNGTVMWQKTYGGLSGDYVYDVAVTDDGYVLSGMTYSYGDRKALLIKVDTDGEQVWNRTYGVDGSYECATSIVKTSEGGFAFTGSTTVDGYGNNDCLLVKVDANGNQVWGKIFGGAFNDDGYILVQNTDGSFTIAGRTYSISNDSSSNILLVTTENSAPQYNLTINTTGLGSVLPGNASYISGTPVDLVAMAPDGWRLDGWSGDASGTSNATILMYSDKTITAAFARTSYNITVIAYIDDVFYQSGNRTYPDGAMLEINATYFGIPDSLYVDHWNLDGTYGYNSSLSLTMTQDYVLTAYLQTKLYQLDIVQATGGSTNATSGSYIYAYGQNATVTATADGGYTFIRWLLDGEVNSTNPEVSILMYANHTLTPVFRANVTPPPINSYMLIVNSATGGTTNPGTGSHTYNQGSVVTITATASAGYVFSNWIVDGVVSNVGSSLSINMNRDHTVTPVFASMKPQLTINAATGGSTGPQAGTYSYDYGNSVSVTATASTGYTFNHWIVDGQAGSSNATITLTMNANHTLTPVFSQQNYTLTVSAATGGVTNPTSGTYTYNIGETATVSAAPSSGYQFDHWVLDGQAAGSSTGITVQMNANHSVAAVFTAVTYTLTVNSAVGGSTTPASGVYTYSYGQTATVTASAAEDYRFVNWILDGQASTADSAISVQMTAGHTITPVFAEIPAILIATETTTQNTTYPIGITGGNMTVKQMTNMTITPYSANTTTVVSLNVTGPSGTVGTATLALPKEAIPYGTTPKVYIDGVLAENQTYTEDANYYYITFTTHFSEHNISIVFAAQTQPEPTATPTPTPTVTPTVTPTPTTTPTTTPTPTSTPTPTAKPTATPTSTPTATAAVTPSATPVVFTESAFPSYIVLFIAVALAIIIVLLVVYRRKKKQDD